MASEIDKYIYLIRSKDTPMEIALNRMSGVTGDEDFKRIFDGVIDSGEVIRNRRTIKSDIDSILCFGING